MNINNSNLIVGILTSMRHSPRLDGNKRYFEILQHELLGSGGISYLFSPSSMGNSIIEGAIFLPRNNKWISSTFPYPHVVYNRIPFREEEETEEFMGALSTFQSRNIPYFNLHFFYKDKLFKLFQRESLTFIPETIIPESKLHMMKFIRRHNHVYAKPTNQSRGNGILRLTFHSTHTILQQDLNNVEKDIHTNELFPYLIQNNYILQRAIHKNTVDGNPYDLRVLVHYIHHTFTISGIGIRVAKHNHITTHVQHGGTIVPLSTVAIDTEKVQYIATTCGQILQQEYGNIYEFSLDIGIEGSNYYLFEINSKPMIFDEKHIKATGIKNLIQIFTELTP